MLKFDLKSISYCEASKESNYLSLESYVLQELVRQYGHCIQSRDNCKASDLKLLILQKQVLKGHDDNATIQLLRKQFHLMPSSAFAS